MNSAFSTFKVPHSVLDRLRRCGIDLDSDQLAHLLASYASTLIMEKIPDDLPRTPLDPSRYYDEFLHYREYAQAQMPNPPNGSAPHVIGFAILALFKSAPDHVTQFAKFIGQMRQHYAQQALTSFRMSDAFTILGRFNLGLILSGPNLEILTSVYYSLLRSSTKCEGFSIIDSVKIMFFEWADLHPALAQRPQYLRHCPRVTDVPAAIVLVKLDMRHLEKDSLASTAIAQSLERFCNRDQIVHAVYGGLSWHEVIIYIYSTDHSAIASVASHLRMEPHICDTNTIIIGRPIPEPGADKCTSVITNDGLSADIVECKYQVRLLALSRIRPDGFRVGEECDLPPLATGEALAFGYGDHIAEVRANSFLEASQMLEAHFGPSAPLDMEALFVFIEGDGKHRRGDWADRPGDGMFAGSDTPETVDLGWQDLPTSESITAECSIEKLLYVFAAQTECLVRRVGEVFGIDNRFASSVKFIAEGHRRKQISSGCAIFALSALRSALRDRLAGPSVAAGNQLMGGMGEQYGGYNVLLLACESLMAHALSFSLARELQYLLRHPIQPRDFSPFCLVSFEATDIEQSVQRHQKYAFELGKHMHEGNLPVLIRLPLEKYQPWNWVLGIQQLRGWMEPILEPSRATASWAGLDSHYGLPLLSLFLEERVLEHLLRLAAGDVVPVLRRDGTLSRIDIVRDVQAHALPSAERRARYWNESVETMRRYETEYVGSLRQGEIITSAFSDGARYAAFLSAYSRLPRSEAAAAPAFCSFVLSLYRRHPQFQQ